MRILDVMCENFRLHADTTVEFPLGVTGIIGDNESGKSTIATEALLWCFYGGKAVRGTMEGVRWNRAPERKTAKVEVGFEIGGKVYRVKRTESNAWVHEGDNLIAQGTNPVNKLMPNLIGMGHDEFTTSFLVKQKDVAAIASMQPTERQAFVRKVMGVGKIDVGLKKCREEKSRLSVERDGLMAGLGQREPLEDAINEALKECGIAGEALDKAEQLRDSAAVSRAVADKAFTESETKRRAHEQLVRERDDAARDHARVVKTIDGLKVKSVAIKEAIPRLKEAAERLAALPGLRKEKAELEAAARGANRKAELLNSIDAWDEEIVDLDRKIGEYEYTIAAYSEEEWGEAVAVFEKAQDALVAMVLARSTESTKLMARANHLRAGVEELQAKAQSIATLGRDGCCPTCTQVLGENFDAVYDGIMDEMVKLEEEEQKCRNGGLALMEVPDDEVDAEVERDNAQEAMDKIREAKQEAATATELLASTNARFAQVTRDRAKAIEEISEIGEVVQDPITLRKITGMVTDLEMFHASEELARDRALASSAEETMIAMREAGEYEVDALLTVKLRESSILETGFIPEDHDAITTKLAEARQKAETAEVGLATAREALKGWERTLEGRKKALGEYDRRAVTLKDVEANHMLHEKTAKRLAEFRVAIATTIRPEMEELMSGFIQLLTDGRHEAVELSEDFAATLYEGGLAIEVVSGGCEDIAALAMRLALSQMIAERAGHPLSLLVLDEPFGSLDKNRRQNVLNLIRRLKGTFEQVIVISHIDETKDAVDFVIEFVFDEAAGRTRLVA